MTTIFLARHGNTFDPGDTVVRVGLKTDLPLSNSGKLQAIKLGEYFKAQQIRIDAVFTSSLRRTIETAQIALETAGVILSMRQNHMFDEIDYGPDEGKTETEVLARIGDAALQAWDQNTTVPQGWIVDPQQIIQNWHHFANMLLHKLPEQNVLIVTSNGIARFAPHLIGDFENFAQNNKIKLSTGALCKLSNKNGEWQIEFWDLKV